MQDENRILVREGLKRLSNTANEGLLALMRVTDIFGNAITVYHIGFVIGPCLNASGRLDTAKRSIELFLTKDRELAEKYAGELKALNDERKNMTDKAADEAIDMVNNTKLKDDVILVIYMPDCHESIAGIVAGRVKDAFYKPAIVLTRSVEGVKGSARSIETYNIFEKLLEAKSLLTKFGGHPIAAGLSLKEDNVEVLRRFLNANHGLTDSDLVRRIWIDVPMPLNYISYRLIGELEGLAPFGKGNEKPVFADRNLVIRQVNAMGKNNNYTRLKLEDKNGCVMPAVGFFDSTELKAAYNEGKTISCTYYPDINDYRGNKSLQINITGYKIEE